MIPDHLFSKKKQGFSIPVNQWLRTELKTFLIDTLHSETFRNLHFFNHDVIDRMMKEHFEGKANQGNILWTLMILGLWNQSVRTS